VGKKGEDPLARFFGESDLAVCALALREQQVKTCLPAAVAVTATAPPLNLRQGRRITVRLDDPQGHLDQHEGKTSGAHLLLGVGFDGLHRTPQLITTTRQERVYELLAPVNTPVAVSLHSAFFDFDEDNGTPITRGRSKAVPGGQTLPATVRFKVTGASRKAAP